MTIRKKLIASYIAIIIVPCILFMIAIGALFFSFAGKDQFINPALFGEQAKVEHELFSKLKLMTTSEPEKLIDETYLQSVNSEFIEYNLYLLVRVNNEIVHLSEDIKSLPLTHYLTSFGEFKKHSHDFVTIDQKAFKFDQHDFYFPDQKQGSIFVIKEANAIEQFTTKFFGWLLILLLLILIGTYGTISYLVSRNIIHPLTALKDATEKIKAGDLNFKTDTKRKDEIGALSASFEEMRVQLKKSVDMQLKYEENRKLLLSNISHDLKTPITSIKGYVEGIQDGIANNPEKLERYISTIYKKANDMDAMIDELFLFSKLDLKRIPFHFERTDILQYVEECVEDVALDLKGKNLKVEFVHSLVQPVFVSVDREKLMRVFSNIISNSVKYMDKERGVITLSVMVQETHVQITIKDNGSGISKESLPFIFDHFYRADQSRNSHKGGSGLGLAIARQIIEGHGGEIWANSHKNEGTEIHFTVKREQA
ncbi:sensor histidine kinase [Cytobacillus sp. FJAT-54145]|uniref:histidine kinase n=1 Tax=Cytobacillus spartinae TaxID=3299023 RepID=A0ABW6K689_9BACI